jgi:hypothetical protein
MMQKWHDFRKAISRQRDGIATSNVARIYYTVWGTIPLLTIFVEIASFEVIKQ